MTPGTLCEASTSAPAGLSLALGEPVLRAAEDKGRWEDKPIQDREVSDTRGGTLHGEGRWDDMDPMHALKGCQRQPKHAGVCAESATHQLRAPLDRGEAFYHSQLASLLLVKLHWL